MEQTVISRRQLRRSFDLAAPRYDQIAALPREIARRMLERLALVRVPLRTIVDAGSGTGHGARLLRRKYKQALVLELDFSEHMLRQGRAGARYPLRWLGFRGGRHRICADFQQMPLAASSADLVWSNLAFHWSLDLAATLQRVHRVLRPGGLLMFSVFGPDTLRELRAAASEGEFRINQHVDMHDIGDMLVHSGFADPVMDMEVMTLTYADLRSLLHDLRSHGSRAISGAPRAGLVGRRRFLRLAQQYERFRRSDGRLPATFEVIYGHAWKPPARVSPKGKPVIDLSPA